MSDLLETVRDLADRAGRITLQYFQGDLDIITKSDESPVTIADRETEKFLRGEIERLFPSDSILGEEFGASGSGGRKWIIDPIDGTKTFVHGVPLYGVMIGVEQDGEIIAGAINMAGLQELVVAEKGCGTWWNGKRAAVSKTERLADALLLTTDHANNFKYGHGPEWERLSSAARLVRTWGDCYGYVLVATGRADIMVDPQLSPWDAAAPKIIVEEAGGSFTDFLGNSTIYGNCGIAMNPSLSSEVLALTASSS